MTVPGQDWAPELSATATTSPVVRAKASSSTVPYEGASQKRRLIGWNAPTTGPNRSTLPHLTLLRDRSRSATRNNAYARGVINKQVTNLIGTGIKPLALLKDEAQRQALQALWDRWTEECDADGLLDFYGQQTQSTRCVKEGGEVFVRLRPRLPSDGLSVPLQVQLLEPELVPVHHDTVTPSGGRVRAGIEFSPIGRRLAYWFHPSRPDLPEDFDASQLRRVPADAVIHCYDPLRAGQIRGVPDLSPALVKLYTLEKCDDADLVRQHIQNLFAGFITRPADVGTVPLHPLTGLPISDDSTGDDGEELTLTLNAGLMQELNPGEEITFSEPPGPTNGYKDFMRQQLLAVAAATNTPYEVFAGDLSGLNDRVVRVILNEFRRYLQAYQHQIIVHQICRRVWRAFVEAAWLSGAIDLPVEYVMHPVARWMPQAWPYIHPVQDVEAAQLEVRNGLASRSGKVSERGDDVEVIDAEQAADNTRADELGLKYDSDGRQPKNGGQQKNASSGSRAAA